MQGSFYNIIKSNKVENINNKGWMKNEKIKLRNILCNGD